MTDKPTSLQLAVAMAIAVEAGHVVISDDLASALADANARRRAGFPVSEAELRWIDAELQQSPGFAEWQTRQMLDQTLRQKAFT